LKVRGPILKVPALLFVFLSQFMFHGSP
jgi:hypothetical protein